MFAFGLCLAVLVAADGAPEAAQERLQALHLQEAAHWTMFVGADRQAPARLQEAPVYIWTNPVRSGGQNGAVYVWLDRGRPVVIGTIFSFPTDGRRAVWNEFHSLAPGDLRPERAEGETWRPQAPVKLERLPGSAAPEDSPSRRLIQMRAIGRQFSAHSVDNREERWQLRLLTQPLYRYQQPDADTIDGALFAFVTSAGADPELILALEARRSAEGAAWYYRLLRFSDSNLYVERGSQQVWTSIRDDRNQFNFNPDQTYRLISDKVIDELPELAPR